MPEGGSYRNEIRGQDLGDPCLPGAEKELEKRSEVLEVLAENAEPQAGPLTGFVVSITKAGKFRRLHFAGACRLVPGIDYQHYDHHGDIAPAADQINARCRTCIPANQEQAVAEALEAAEGSSSDSGSDTSRDEAGSE